MVRGGSDRRLMQTSGEPFVEWLTATRTKSSRALEPRELLPRVARAGRGAATCDAALSLIPGGLADWLASLPRDLRSAIVSWIGVGKPSRDASSVRDDVDEPILGHFRPNELRPPVGRHVQDRIGE